MLENFFDYQANFCYLNSTFKDQKATNKFHSSNVEFFKHKIIWESSEESINWHFRSFRSLREIFHSSLMHTESKVIQNQYCIASVFFTKYYAFLHAVKAVLYLTPIENFSPRLGHAQSINIFISNYCQGKRKIFEKDDFEEFAKLLRDLREVTSYQIPHSGSDFLSEKDFNKIDNKLTITLKKLYQLAHYLSFITEKVHKSIDIRNNYKLFMECKVKYFNTPHPIKEEHMDYSDKVFIYDTLKVNKTYCEPFTIILEHEIDEFLTYGGFGYLDKSQVTFKTEDVTSFIWNALN